VTQQTSAVTFQTSGTWYDYLNATTINATGGAQSMTLQPGEYHVYLNRPVTNLVTTAVPSLTAVANKLLVEVYPNPVNQKAVIDVSVPVNGNVQIDMMNQQGQKLKNLFSGFLTKGEHRIEFEQNQLPAGVYILNIISKTSTAAIKIVQE